MNKQKNKKTTWWERNKKKVLIAGGILVVTGVGIIVFKNKDELISFLKNVKISSNDVSQLSDISAIETLTDVTPVASIENVTVKKPLNNGLPFDVCGGIRNLSGNRHPSAEKIAQAEKLGITLGEHQTLVNSFTKNAA